MKHTNFPRFVSLLIAIGINITLYSQTNKEVVILYNSKPVLAEISADGTVNRIIKEMPDGLEGFSLKVFDYEKFLEENKKEDSNVIANQSYVVISTEFQEISFERVLQRSPKGRLRNLIM